MKVKIKDIRFMQWVGVLSLKMAQIKGVEIFGWE
jgi:hypothetical protein